MVVDQSVAFLGGLDLCWGRWDDPQHRLVDIGQGGPVAEQADGGVGTRLGRTVDSSRPNLTGQAIQSVTMQLLAQHCVLDLALAPVQSVTDSSPSPAGEPLTRTRRSRSLRRSARQVLQRVQTVRRLRAGADSDEEEEMREVGEAGPGAEEPGQSLAAAGLRWPGKDYVNWIVRDLGQPELAAQDNMDRLVAPRMPWHDIGLGVVGPAARDAARHFIQRWNHLKKEKLVFNPNYSFLVPKAYSEAAEVGLPGGQQVRCQVDKSNSIFFSCKLLSVAAELLRVVGRAESDGAEHSDRPGDGHQRSKILCLYREPVLHIPRQVSMHI